MTGDEWGELAAWIDTRWPNQWHAEQAVAYYHDLDEFDASDVWAGLYHLYNQGLRFAPNGSQLKAATISERRQAALEDRYDSVALPEPVETETGRIGRLYPGETVDASEHIRRVHESKGPCGSRFCDIHTDQPVPL